MVRLVIMIYVVGGVSYVGCGCSRNVVSMKLPVCTGDSAPRVVKMHSQTSGLFYCIESVGTHYYYR